MGYDSAKDGFSNSNSSYLARIEASRANLNQFKKERKKVRASLSADILAFLDKGGKVKICMPCQFLDHTKAQKRHG